MSFNLGDALRTAALRDGPWSAIVEDDRETSARELDRAAGGVASELARRGVGPGTRIALTVENSAPHLAAMFGAWRAGATLVPLNPRLTEGEVEHLLRHSRAWARLAVDRGSGALRVEECGGESAAAARSDSASSRPHRAAQAPSVATDHPAVIAYTSGTTGRPKGVVLTHANMLWAAAAVVQTRRDHFRSVAAVVSPLCHIPIFVSHYLARLLSGGKVVLGTFHLDRVVRMIREHGVTDLPLVPAMIGPLLEHPELGNVEQLVKVTVGSSFTPMEVKHALADRFPRAEIIEAYGQTESTDGLTMTVGREALARPGTVGRGHALFALAIQAPDGARLAPGEVGEIVAQGPTVMQGYLDDEQATRATIREGWLHTGDLGRLDEDGYLFITGRLKEIIISGGENVSPEEVEGVLSQHPAVGEVAVFGAPHPRWGEQVTAAVVRKGGATLSASELVEFARPSLARFKLPRAVLFVDTLPKTSAGKVKRRELRDELQRRQAEGESP
ncbi:MAG TPA: AMP-binding protein [Candidatus Bathyarchaeia archaeon]|nr:AMP-binding protein [Candidatus Bathyarchaeia archaeon]